MTASATNGFGEVQFAPTGSRCNNIPYDFHPMYATSSTETRVPWAAHSYNVSFSDEIGHFEYCNAVLASGSCRTAGVSEPNGKTDGDDDFCFPASASLRVQVSGCTDSDGDFDGASYRNNWPGTGATLSQDAALHPTSLLLSSPLTNGSNYQQTAFEADLPRIERSDFGGICNGTTGANCVNPPPGAPFYPIYTTGTSGTGCVWQLGGPNIPGTTNTFGGTSATDYGDQPLQLFYPRSAGPSSSTRTSATSSPPTHAPVVDPVRPPWGWWLMPTTAHHRVGHISPRWRHLAERAESAISAVGAITVRDHTCRPGSRGDSWSPGVDAGDGEAFHLLYMAAGGGDEGQRAWTGAGVDDA
jgi:hypothetical protein